MRMLDHSVNLQLLQEMWQGGHEGNILGQPAMISLAQSSTDVVYLVAIIWHQVCRDKGIVASQQSIWKIQNRFALIEQKLCQQEVAEELKNEGNGGHVMIYMQCTAGEANPFASFSTTHTTVNCIVFTALLKTNGRHGRQGSTLIDGTGGRVLPW
jgi:hypothetical protein